MRKTKDNAAMIGDSSYQWMPVEKLDQVVGGIHSALKGNQSMMFT